MALRQLGVAPTNANDTTTKSYVDASTGGAPRLFYRGNWVQSVAYYKGELVNYNGRLYEAIADIPATNVPTEIGQSGTSNGSAKTTATTVSIPAACQAGDYVVLAINLHTASSGTNLISYVSAPSYATQLSYATQYTTVSANMICVVYGYKLLAADITAGTLTIPAQTSGNVASGAVLDAIGMFFRNVAGYEKSAGPSLNAGTNTTDTLTVGSTTTAGCFEVFVYAAGTTGSQPTSYSNTPSGFITQSVIGTSSVRGGLYAGAKAISTTNTDSISATGNWASQAFSDSLQVLTLSPTVVAFAPGAWNELAADVITPQVITASQTATVMRSYLMNCGANTTLTLPSGAYAGDEVWVSRVDTNGAYTCTIAASGTDVINVGANLGVSSLTLGIYDDSVKLISDGFGNWNGNRAAYGTATNVASTGMRRDASGNAYVSNPASGTAGAQSVTNRTYVDGKLKQPFPDQDPADLKWHYPGMYGEPTQAALTNYNPDGKLYSPVRFRKNEIGEVFIEGLVTPSTTAGTVVFTLPPGYRPAYTIQFSCIQGASTPVGIWKINSAGQVIVVNALTSFASFDGLSFMAEDYNAPTWNTPAYGTGWSKYSDATYAPLRYYQDDAGDVHLSGSVAGGSTGSGFPIFTLPAGYYDATYTQMFSVPAGTGQAQIYVNTAGAVYVNAYTSTGGNTLVSLDGIVLSNASASWAGFTTALGNSWLAYGSPWPPAQICFNKYGTIAIRGLVKNGTTTTGTAILATGSINPEFAPTMQKTFLVPTNAGAARVDVSYAGAVIFQNFLISGTNGFVSIAGRWNSPFNGRR